MNEYDDPNALDDVENFDWYDDDYLNDYDHGLLEDWRDYENRCYYESDLYDDYDYPEDYGYEEEETDN